jgi:hypothetical protein
VRQELACDFGRPRLSRKVKRSPTPHVLQIHVTSLGYETLDRRQIAIPGSVVQVRSAFAVKLHNVEVIRVKEGATGASHQACLTQTSDPLIG